MSGSGSWPPAGFVVATALFAGDLTLRHYAGHGLFPMAAPTGGTLLIASWLALAVAAAWPKRVTDIVSPGDGGAMRCPDEGSIRWTTPHRRSRALRTLSHKGRREAEQPCFAPRPPIR